jgi:hypothetical protein
MTVPGAMKLRNTIAEFHLSVGADNARPDVLMDLATMPRAHLPPLSRLK